MQPLFIISQPRAGSTLLQALVSNHEHVCTVSEPWVQLLAQGVVKSDFLQGPCNWLWVLEALKQNAGEIDWKTRLQSQLKEFADDFYAHHTSGSSTRYFLDKTPRYYFILNELYDAYPNARFLLLRRDQASVVLSMCKTWLQGKHSQALDMYSWDLIEAPRLMRQFEEGKSGSDRIFTIRYEALLENPARELSALLGWLGLQYRDALLDYSSNADYVGGFGDPGGIKQGKLVPAQLPPSPKKYREQFANKTIAHIAQGLSHYHMLNGDMEPTKALWEKPESRLSFNRFLFRHNVKHWQMQNQNQLPGFFQSLRLTADRALGFFTN